MIKALMTAALLAAAAPALAVQTRAAPPIDPRVAALRDAALNDQYAWDITEGLSTEIGPRLAGTAAEQRARDWAVAKRRAMGFSNVRVETFPLTVWDRNINSESAYVVAPFPQHLRVTALGGSPPTPRGGIEGRVVGFDSMEA